MSGFRKEGGFTLIEMLVAMGILSILAAIAISYYHNYRVRVYDATAKSDLKNALSAAENYYVANDSFPAVYTDLFTTGFNFSKDVCFTRYQLENNGQRLHIHIMHTSSSSAWHTRYPDDAGAVDFRTPASCL